MVARSRTAAGGTSDRFPGDEVSPVPAQIADRFQQGHGALGVPGGRIMITRDIYFDNSETGESTQTAKMKFSMEATPIRILNRGTLKVPRMMAESPKI